MIHVRAIQTVDMLQRLSPADRIRLNGLMLQLAGGDRSAFSPIFAQLWPRVRLWCARLVGDEDAAEDLAQQTLHKLFFQATCFDPAGDVLTWALTLASWECRTWRTQRLRREKYHLPESISPLSPEQEILKLDLESVLHMLMDRLSPSDKDALEIGVGEHGHPWTAAFRKRRQRALARLKRLWVKHEHENTKRA